VTATPDAKLPPRRGFLVAAGLEQALDFLENFRFSAEEIDWLGGTDRFGRDLLDHLANFRFSGEVHAMPEGTVFFANEPILRVTAPLPEAQLAETRLINIPTLPVPDCIEGGANNTGGAWEAAR
jgi:nicotinate phosphoribosyltransferase